jgi:L-alanine-DL-glutamate epimerase-like enolase superfamily enzyme
MKIARITSHSMVVSRPRSGMSGIRRNRIFVRLETEAGLTGLGEFNDRHGDIASL